MTDTLELYESLGGSYLTSMYQENTWTQYVDQVEKSAVLRALGSNTTGTILDLGMGPGRWSAYFISLGFSSVYGLDISPNMVTSATKFVNSSKFHPSVGNMESLAFSSHQFHIIFCFRAFKYVTHPSTALSEVYRVLIPDGQLLLEVSNLSIYNRTSQMLSSFVLKLFPRIPIQSKWRYFTRAKFYSLTDISQLLHQCHFQVVSVYPLFVLPSIPLPTELTPLLKFLDTVGQKILPSSLFARSWLLVTKKST